MRGKFSLDTLAKRLLEQAKQKESSLIVTSTCNRPKYTAEHPFQLIKLICEVMVALKSFKVGFVYKIKRQSIIFFKLERG
jgi:uncharacterized Fe-S cluster-containing radical SAM superfamily protein